MLTNLQKVNTEIVRIHEIPTRFFEQIEASAAFGDHLFPDWTRKIYDGTTLFAKFEAVYDKYKAIDDEASRALIVRAFQQNNRVEDLCNLVQGVNVIEIRELDNSIQEEIKTLFRFLYTNSLNYHAYTDFVGITVSDSIDAFNRTNKVQICPFCGVEAFLNLEGQSRLALDHWLCQDLFPLNSVNFDNLIPIGDKCNARPVKAERNILIDGPATRNRIRAYYPYQQNQGITTSFRFVNEPTIDNPISDDDWEFDFIPNEPGELEIFNSWKSVFNIETRYLDYYRKNIFDLWEDYYKEWVEDEDNNIQHATNLEEFRGNLGSFKAFFSIKRVIGSVVMRPFLNYLISDASDALLTGLYMQFNE